MNMHMNHIPNPQDRTSWHKFSEIIAPPPSNAFVFIDEHESSIDNARFTVTQRHEWRWIDFAGTRHNDGCVLSFADGHSELWKWKESRTLEISKMKGWIQGQSRRVREGSRPWAHLRRHPENPALTTVNRKSVFFPDAIEKLLAA